MTLAGKLFVFDRATAKATELKTGAGGAIVDPKWSPNGAKIAYVRGFDVYVYDLAAGKESAVTTGGTAIKTHGQAEFVAQEEMGRHSGFWWSPDSKFIAYEEADHTGVETWYVADPLKPDQKPAEQFYPRPGKKNVAVKLGIVPVSGGETVWVEWDREKWEYLADVTWQKYGLPTILLQDRKQQEAHYFAVELSTGKLARLNYMGDEEFINLHPQSLRWLKQGIREKGMWYFWVKQSALIQGFIHTYALAIDNVDSDPGFGGKNDVNAGLTWEIGGIENFRELIALDPETNAFIISHSVAEGGGDELDPTQTKLNRIRLPN